MIKGGKQITTELVVIGAGPGGYAAAFYAADLGMNVTLIDYENNPGGVCLYRGCIPSKALLHAAKLITEAKEAEAIGIKFGSPKIDVKKLATWKSSVVEKLTSGLGGMVKQRKITYIKGRASFLDANTLKVLGSDGEEVDVNYQNAILATGSRPTSLPTINFESPHVLNSTSALELKDIPKTLLVIGGGYIGLELSSVYAALGTQVTIVEMAPTLLSGVDADLVMPLTKRLQTQVKSILLSTKILEIAQNRKGIAVKLESPDGKKTEQVFEKVLVAIGRKPNSSGLELGNTRVTIDQRGFVIVNEKRQTQEPSIYAIGDVAGEPMLAHKASHEARVAVDAIRGENVVFEPQAIPAVVFTDPEIAWCGLTETQAKKDSREIAVAKFPWAASGRALSLNRGDGFTKLIIDPQTEVILGVGITGPGAGELIAEGVLAVEMGTTATDLKLCIHPHPTLSETLMEAAEVFFGQSTHVYRPKRPEK